MEVDLPSVRNPPSPILPTPGHTTPLTIPHGKHKYSQKPLSAAGRDKEAKAWALYAATTQAIADEENQPVATVRQARIAPTLRAKTIASNAWNGFSHEYNEDHPKSPSSKYCTHHTFIIDP